MFEDGVSLILRSGIERSICIPSEINDCIGIDFTEVINGVLEESKFLNKLGFLTSSWEINIYVDRRLMSRQLQNDGEEGTGSNIEDSDVRVQTFLPQCESSTMSC